MQRIYQPDAWVVLRLVVRYGSSAPSNELRVLAGWRGGFLTADCWRMNSGIDGVAFVDGSYLITSKSGSVYRCGLDDYGVSPIMVDGLHTIQSQPQVLSADIVDDRDWADPGAVQVALGETSFS
uniref:Uncharacterized protein n=1 Tax=Alloyangia mangrovi TaxID=1779329 RepID=A0A2A3K0S1_9RHOB